jgi:hypothetical protein
MQDNKPELLDLMEDWRAEFNKTNSRGYQMIYQDFTQQYICMKVRKADPAESMEGYHCIAHLYDGRTNQGYGVEFINKDGVEFIRPEDPTFFPRLLSRVEEKLPA